MKAEQKRTMETTNGERMRCRPKLDRLGVALGLTLSFGLALGATVEKIWADVKYRSTYPPWDHRLRNWQGNLEVGLWDWDLDEGWASEGWPDGGLKIRDVNRAAAIIAVVVSFGVAVYYVISATCCVSRAVEISLATLVLASGILTLASFGVWQDAFSDDKFVKKFLNGRLRSGVNVSGNMCGPGCVLQGVSGVIQVCLALGMLLIATQNWFRFYPPVKSKSGRTWASTFLTSFSLSPPVHDGPAAAKNSSCSCACSCFVPCMDGNCCDCVCCQHPTSVEETKDTPLEDDVVITKMPDAPAVEKLPL